MSKSLKYNNLLIFYSNTEDGNMSKKYGNESTVIDNQKRFFYNIGISNNNYYLKITNGDIIKEFSEPSDLDIEADAIISRSYNKFFYLAFGDCIPMVVYDKKNDIVVFAHLGWKSICLDLHKKVIIKLLDDYNSSIRNLIIYFGPAIAANSYVFSNPAQLHMPEWKSFVKKIGNSYSVDLISYIIKGLIDIGVDLKQIKESKVDTATNLDFFSHYRSVHSGYPEGRFIFGAGLQK